MTQAAELNLRDLISPQEAAELVGVTVRTIRRWSEKGYLVSIRTPGGRRFYRRDDVEKLLTVHGPEAVA